MLLIEILNFKILNAITFGNGIVFTETIRLQGPGYGNFDFYFHPYLAC